MLGLKFDLGEDVYMLRDAVRVFAEKEIAPPPLTPCGSSTNQPFGANSASRPMRWTP